MLKKILYATFIYTFIIPVAFSTTKETTISLDFGQDELDNTSSILSVDMDLENSKRLFWGLGKNKTFLANKFIENNISFIGLSKKMNDDFKITGMLELSGLKDAFTIFSTSAGVRYSQNYFYIELVPALRKVTLTTLSNREVKLSSTALGFKAGFFIGEHFRLSGSTYRYDYSRNVSVLSSFASTQFFNTQTLALSSSLLSESYNVEAGLDYDSFSVSLGKNSSISAIDNSSIDYAYSVLDYFLSDTWGLSLLFGKYLDTPANQDNYTSVTISYSF